MLLLMWLLMQMLMWLLRVAYAIAYMVPYVVTYSVHCTILAFDCFSLHFQQIGDNDDGDDNKSDSQKAVLTLAQQ